MTVLTIGCIIILMIVALNFIWEWYRAHEALDQVIPTIARLALRSEHFEKELRKYERKRNSRGRFIKGGS